ncbi:TrkH family potassium uptake protein [Loktanella sp. DJP18]|uniref:TrkH family potassium uptake protein n=1 Tax=Loktanella sp. DJP18 TaxID=3409788 RepID=UPI003BB73FB1
MSFIVFVNGMILIFFAVLMGLNALLFPATAHAFFFAMAVVGVPGVLLCLVSSSSDYHLRRAQTFLLTSTVWFMAAVAGAVPLMVWSLTPTDALFEAMSGITTTGATVMAGLDAIPHGIIMWRAMLQAVGGVGFIVTGIAILPLLKVGGMQLFRTESSDKGEKELPSAALFASATLQIYAGLIVICAFVYLAGGMTGFDAITHAMTTLSTGGFSGHDASFGFFQSPFLQWAGTLFMLLGALPFAWYIRVLRGGSFRSEQVAAMVKTLTLVIVLLTIWLVARTGMPPLTALRLVAFNVISVVTTTGYATTDYTAWGPFAVTVFFVLTAVGGCTGSTAGGAKAMRWLLLGRSIKAQIQALFSPHRVVTVRYEGHRVEADVIGGLITFFMVYLTTFAILSIMLTLLGLDVETAASGALTALANVGPGVGSIIGPAGNFSSLSDPVKLTLVLGMFLGRLELLTVLVLLMPLFWSDISAR